jgi:hypothetical protein
LILFALEGVMTTRYVPTAEEVQRAVQSGDILGDAHLRALIEIDARALGMSPDEAIIRARAGTLPRTPIADDLILLLGIEAS